MLKNRLKVLLFAGMGAVGLGLLTWAGMSVSAKQATAETDAIAAEIFQQYPATEQNTSAQTLEMLSAQLGLKLVSHDDSPAFPTPDETAAFQPIKPTVRDYFKVQIIKENGSLDALPASVQAYLNDNQATLTEIQTHLQSQDAPVWHFDVDLYADFDYPVPALMGLVDLNQLLLLNAIHHAQQNQPEQMVAALEASQVLYEIPAARPDFNSYLISLRTMDDAVAIMRHLEGVPASLSEQRLSTDQQQLGAERLRLDRWMFYKELNRALNGANWTKEDSFFSENLVLSAVFSFGAIEKPYLELANSNSAHLYEKHYEQVIGQNVCSLDVDALEETMEKAIPWWNMLGTSFGWAARWRDGATSMLSAELTHHVIRAKALAAEQGQWPETLSDLDSQTCPGEQWVYDVNPEGQMSLSFSRELDWRNNPSDPQRPLTYQALLSD